MTSSTTRAFVAKKPFATASAFMAKTNQLLSTITSLRLLLVMFVALTASAEVWGATYKLTKVTSVSAGEMYVFEQDGYVMNNNTSSSALQCTNSYKTTGLTGTETYIWTLESTNGGFYMRNVNLKSNYYLKNSSKTGVSLTTTSSIWKFTFDNKTGEVLIQNTENDNRFLGYTSSDSHAYKAYATSNLTSYPHAITVYKLEEEALSCTNQVTITKAATTGGSFKVHQGSASGTEISSSGKIDNCDANAVVVVVPSASANYTCTSVNATNSNSISGPDGSGNYTITYTIGSNISSEISVTFTENQTHTVKWMVNEIEYTEGNPTASVYEGAKWSSLTLPTAPNPNDYCGQVFAGWTTTNIGSTGLDKDNDATAIQNLNLMTSENKSSKTNTITEPITFYAVFADYAD